MNAKKRAKKYSHYICHNLGGKGAVREFIEFILRAKGKFNLIHYFLEE